MEKAPRERRKYPRVNLKMSVSFQSVRRGEVSSKFKTHSDNVSPGGIALESLSKLRRGQILMLNLMIPSKAGLSAEEAPDFCKSKGQTIAILSRVAYCTALSPRQFRLGIQFLDLAQPDRKILKKFLVQCHMLVNNSELYG